MKLALQTLATLLATIIAWPQFAFAQSAVVPVQKSTRTLVLSADTPATPYLAFPALLDPGDDVLVSFKRGHSHKEDSGAALDLVRLDRATGQVKSRSTLAQAEGQIMQMGEWVRFANGDIASYIDTQQKELPKRIGLRVVRSGDGGQTFGPVEQVGLMDGVEYGYAFEAITRDKTTWLLVMTYGNLTGGKAFAPTGGKATIDSHSEPGSVDVIRTDDNGKTWRLVRSITRELGGAAINESSFVTHGDGFLIAARGYDERQWLLRTDGDFKIQRKVDLASSHAFIKFVIGRPRVFARDGGWYLLARNFMPDTAAASKKRHPMQLSLFKFDPETLLITRHVVLDNAERAKITDGYYAMPYWQERAGRTCFNIITYKRLADLMPDIIRLEFNWEEVR